MVVNGDVYTDYPFARLLARAPQLDADGVLAHLVLVANPSTTPGRFCPGRRRPRARCAGADFLRHWRVSPGPVCRHPGPCAGQTGLLLRAAMARGQVNGECWDGQWLDVGTPARLDDARALAAGA